MEISIPQRGGQPEHVDYTYEVIANMYPVFAISALLSLQTTRAIFCAMTANVTTYLKNTLTITHQHLQHISDNITTTVITVLSTV